MKAGWPSAVAVVRAVAAAPAAVVACFCFAAVRAVPYFGLVVVSVYFYLAVAVRAVVAACFCPAAVPVVPYFCLAPVRVVVSFGLVAERAFPYFYLAVLAAALGRYEEWF